MYASVFSTTSLRTGPREICVRREPITRCLALTVVGLMAPCTIAGPALAAEATMRMRGSTQTFTGNVIEFDGQSYLIENEVFGKIYIDTRRFECIAGACAENDGSAAKLPENATIAPSGSKTPRSPLTEEQRQELFRGFLEWRRKSREN